LLPSRERVSWTRFDGRMITHPSLSLPYTHDCLIQVQGDDRKRVTLSFPSSASAFLIVAFPLTFTCLRRLDLLRQHYLLSMVAAPPAKSPTGQEFASTPSNPVRRPNPTLPPSALSWLHSRCVAYRWLTLPDFHVTRYVSLCVIAQEVQACLFGRAERRKGESGSAV
jgi:hypothetical protein